MRAGERKEGEENETVDEGIEKREIRKMRWKKRKTIQLHRERATKIDKRKKKGKRHGENRWEDKG